MAYGLTQSLVTTRASLNGAYRVDDPDQLGDITVEIEIYLTSALTAGMGHCLVGKDDVASERQWAFLINENGASTQLFLRSFSAGGNNSVSVTWVPSLNTFYQCAFTRRASDGQVIFYVDGVQQGLAQDTADGNFDSRTADFMVGARGTHLSPIEGISARFSLLRAWSVVRTQAEIAANRCNVLGATTGLLLEATLNNTYNDNSGNSRTLTAFNSPTFIASVPAICGGGGGTGTPHMALTGAG